MATRDREDDVESEAVQLHITKNSDDHDPQTPETPEPQVVPPDGGYGWVVVAASFTNLIFLSSALLAFTVFLPEFIVELDMKNKTSQASVIGSIQTGFMFFFSVLSGAMISRYGCRPVAILGAALTGLGFIISSHAYVFSSSPFRGYIIICIFYGAVSGMGISLGMNSTLVIVHQYFTERRALASGLSLCGLSIGHLMVGPFLQYLIHKYTLGGALLIQGAMILNGIPLGILFRPLSPRKRLTPTPQVTSPSNASRSERLHHCCQLIFPYWLFKNVDFVLYCIGNFFLSFGSFSYLQHLINACLKFDLTINQATLVLTLLAAVSLVSRLLISFISDWKNISRVMEFGVITIISGLAVAMTLLNRSLSHIIVMASVIVGGCMGASTAIQITILVDLVGTEVLPRASGIFNVFIGISVLFGSPLTGQMVDNTGDYRTAFTLNGCLEIVGGLFVLMIYARRKMNSRRESRSESNQSCAPVMNGHVHSIHGNSDYDNCRSVTGNGTAHVNQVEMGPV